MQKRNTFTLSLLFILTMVATTAFAFTQPSNSLALGYDFYDYANKITSGAPGFAIGIGGLAAAGFFLFKQQVMAAAGMAFGVITVLKATSIVTSLGVLM